MLSYYVFRHSAGGTLPAMYMQQFYLSLWCFEANKRIGERERTKPVSLSDCMRSDARNSIAIAVHLIVPHCVPLHFSVPHCISFTSLHLTAFHCTSLHLAASHCISFTPLHHAVSLSLHLTCISLHSRCLAGCLTGCLTVRLTGCMTGCCRRRSCSLTSQSQRTRSGCSVLVNRPTRACVKYLKK